MLLQELDRLTQLCAISYLPRDEALTSFRELGWKPIALHPIRHWAELYLLLRRDQLTIVVTGSNQLKDWTRRNFRIAPYAVPKFGFVHKGFWAGAKSDWNRIRPVLEALASSGQLPYKVEIVGHSLGAAIAQLLSIHAAELFPMTYMFGAPRVGDQSFALNYYRNPGACWNVRNRYDPIPRVPCRAMGFVHAGIQAVWEDDKIIVGRDRWNQVMKEVGGGEILLRTLAGRGTQAHSNYGRMSKN